jgi:hypothetical protein
VVKTELTQEANILTPQLPTKLSLRSSRSSIDETPKPKRSESQSFNLSRQQSLKPGSKLTKPGKKEKAMFEQLN